MSRFFAISLALFIFTCVSFNSHSSTIGQKVMIDLRYFCSDGTTADKCRTPLTEIGESNRSVITQLLTKHNVGGVILFAENIVNPEQLIRLTYSLQMIMKNAGLPPLFIGIDQEGGRVARLPHDWAKPFAGNMAIGATYKNSGTAFATKVGSAIANILSISGINVNFAPSLDVNVNPNNPVINTRSFGENPHRVAELGTEMVNAMQQQNILTAVKHFPGHGDTHIDSHSGLPQVKHNRQKIEQVDLLPFHKVINDASPAMVMTAHIQYPALDNTQITGREDKQLIAPATLSKTILQTVLRKELGFEGLIVSDALDMAAISKFFTPEQALSMAFKAGVDIALMPLSVRTPEASSRLGTLLSSVEEKLDCESLESECAVSLNRISKTKQLFKLDVFTQKPLSQRIMAAVKNASKPSDMQLEQLLSEQSATVIKGMDSLPLDIHHSILALMPDKARCDALMNEANSLKIAHLDCVSYFSLSHARETVNALKTHTSLWVFDISPMHAMYETGGLDGNVYRAKLSQQQAWLQEQLHTAKQKGLITAFVALRAPYNASVFEPWSDIVIATYDYQVSGLRQTDERLQSRPLQTVLDVIYGKVTASGELPVTLH